MTKSIILNKLNSFAKLVIVEKNILENIDFNIINLNVIVIHKYYLSATSVIKISPKNAILKSIKGYTVEKNLINAHYVGKHFLLVVISKIIKDAI